MQPMALVMMATSEGSKGRVTCSLAVYPQHTIVSLLDETYAQHAIVDLMDETYAQHAIVSLMDEMSSLNVCLTCDGRTILLCSYCS